MSKYLIFCLLWSHFVAAKVVYISDFDDTLKITNTLNPLSLVWNGFLTRKVFAGNPTLYRAFKKNDNKLYILTSSPKTVRYNIKGLLNKHKIKIDGLYTRDSITQDGYKYKFASIEDIMKKNPLSQFVLLGDNSGEDHEVYHAIKEKYGAKVLKIYIRPVKSKPIAEDIFLYNTSFEVASSEQNAGRVESDTVAKVAKDIMDAKKTRVIPPYVKCPIQLNESVQNEPSFDIQKRLDNLCS